MLVFRFIDILVIQKLQSTAPTATPQQAQPQQVIWSTKSLFLSLIFRPSQLFRRKHRLRDLQECPRHPHIHKYLIFVYIVVLTHKIPARNATDKFRCRAAASRRSVCRTPRPTASRNGPHLAATTVCPDSGNLSYISSNFLKLGFFQSSAAGMPPRPMQPPAMMQQVDFYLFLTKIM